MSCWKDILKSRFDIEKYKYIIIIIIMSCRQHGYPWPSHATSPYRLSPLAGLQGYIPYPHIATVCIFRLVVLLLLGHTWGSIGVHYLWARPYRTLLEKYNILDPKNIKVDYKFSNFLKISKWGTQMWRWLW